MFRRALRARRRGGSLSVARMLLCAALLVAPLTVGRSFATEPVNVSATGILWSPDSGVLPSANAVVVALHDSTGIDQRGWRYGDQITAAGIAVLHVELHDNSADGFIPAVAPDELTVALARLTTVLDLLAADPRYANATIGLLAFGDAGRAAMLAAAAPAHGDRIHALALLYPGCAELAAGATTERSWARSPVLLLHGDTDPANLPADCIKLAGQLARSAPVRRREYAGAGYAWDFVPHGPHETVKLPWPGRPGLVVAVSPWPEAAELSAAQTASFFAAALRAQQQ